MTLAALSDVVVGDALGRVPLGVQALVGVLMVATGCWTALRPGRTRAVAFVACALLWSRANQHLEGPVLVSFTPRHGLTLADLLPPAFTALVLARVAVLRGRRTVRHERDPAVTRVTPATHEV